MSAAGGPRGDHRPWTAGPFRWRLGLRPLDLDEWLPFDDANHDREVELKARLLEAHRSTVFAALPEAEGACAEVLDEVVGFVRRHRPGRFLVDDAGITDTGREHRLTWVGRHPLETASLLVHEDLIVMIDDPAGSGELVFGAGSVCFPNRWDLTSKLGQTMRQVHDPVARLNEQLADPIARFFDRLSPERGFWRLGWGLIDTAEPYQPTDGSAAPRPELAGVDDVHLRVERETLRRMPRTGAVLFTIRTFIRPLRDLAGDREDADRLLAALEAMPDDVAAYKQLDAVLVPARAVLRPAGVDDVRHQSEKM